MTNHYKNKEVLLELLNDPNVFVYDYTLSVQGTLMDHKRSNIIQISAAVYRDDPQMVDDIDLPNDGPFDKFKDDDLYGDCENNDWFWW